LHVKKM